VLLLLLLWDSAAGQHSQQQQGMPASKARHVMQLLTTPRYVCPMSTRRLHTL
jgi:hypothetical protein